MKKNISLLFLFFTISALSQSILRGEVLSSDSEKIPYAKLTLQSTDYFVYADTKGEFELKNIRATDTLHISAPGYLDTLVTKFSFNTPLKIQLNKDISTVLEELVISSSKTKTGKERWINFFGNKTGKFRKKLHRNKYFDHQPLLLGYPIMNEFIVPDTITVSGFTVYASSRRTETVTLRPIILKNSSSLRNNLVSDEIVKVSINSSSKNNTEPVPITFNFSKSITFFPGDKINLGLELVDSDYSGSKSVFPFHLICYNKEQIPMTFVTERKDAEQPTGVKILFIRPFYFELKIVE